MKRLPLRELLFVTAPLAIIGLGIWGYQLREQRWPTRPTISCTVNPPTPFELWQGADVGVTVIGIVPNTVPQSNRYSMKCSLPEQSKENRNNPLHSGGTKDYQQLEKHFIYRKDELTSLPNPLTAEVSLGIPNRKSIPIKNSSTITQQFTLSTQGIIPPDIATVQRTNFRVTKVSMFLATSRATRTSIEWHLIIDLKDVESQVAISTTSHKSTCLDLSISKNNKITPLPLTFSSTSIPNNIPTQVDNQIYLDVWKRPFPKNTKILCTLAVAAGWPQIIEAQWPKSPKLNGDRNELKFTTRLAPLPAKT